MDTHVTVIRGAIETEIDTEWYRAPCWVFCAAIETNLHCMLTIVDRPSLDWETYFVGRLCLQFCKDILRLRLRSKRHLDDLVEMRLKWSIRGQVVVGIFGDFGNACLAVPTAKERTCLAYQQHPENPT